MSAKRASFPTRTVALLLAVAGVVALGWMVGQWLPVSWPRATDGDAPPIEEPESSWADQVASVRSGASGTIHVTARPIADGDLAQLTGLPGLQVLLLDHEENAIGDRECQILGQLQGLMHLRIRGGAIGDAGLARLAELPDLKILNLPHCRVTDRGLTALARAPRLAQLRLGSPQITDEGVQHLANLPAIKQLHLIDAPLTDAALETIADWPKLQSLYLDGSRVTDAGLDRLFRARPELHVHVNQQHHDRDPRRGHE